MAVKKDLFRSQFLYFLSIVVFIYVLTNIQSNFLAQLSSPWFHIDFVSIVIVYLSIEHHILFAFIQALIAGSLLQVYSSSPHMFFVFYFVIVVLLSSIFSRLFVVSSLPSKLFIFFIDYLVKYVLFYFSLNNHFAIEIFFLVTIYWKEIISTLCASFFIYQLLLYFDSLFVLPGTIKKR